MLGVDAVPSLVDGQVGCAQELAGVVENEVVDLLLAEDVDMQAVLVRVAEDKGSICGLGDERVNAVLVEVRGFGGYALAERRERFADLEGWIKPQGEASRERRTKLPIVRLRAGAHHLEFAASKAAVGVVSGVQGLEVFAAADEDSFGAPITGSGLEGWRRDGVDKGVEVELDAVATLEEGGKSGQNLAWIDGELGAAP